MQRKMFHLTDADMSFMQKCRFAILKHPSLNSLLTLPLTLTHQKQLLEQDMPKQLTSVISQAKDNELLKKNKRQLTTFLLFGCGSRRCIFVVVNDCYTQSQICATKTEDSQLKFIILYKQCLRWKDAGSDIIGFPANTRSQQYVQYGKEQH